MKGLSWASAAGVVLMWSTAAVSAPAAPVYSPYEFLIGEWEIAEQGAPPAAITRVKWGGRGSYIWIATDLLINGRAVPHYEGMLVWNGVRKDLDMLLTLDPVGAKVQEQGRVWIDGDGTVVRDVLASYAEGVMGPDGRKVGAAGAVFTFQQKFKLLAPDSIETSMMRKTDEGWVPTFPGSDSIMMRRRKPG